MCHLFRSYWVSPTVQSHLISLYDYEIKIVSLSLIGMRHDSLVGVEHLLRMHLRIAVCCSVLQCVWRCVAVCHSVLQCVAVCCSVLQCVAVCFSVLQCVAVCCSVLQCVAVCCSMLQCIAVCIEHQLSRKRKKIREWWVLHSSISTYAYVCARTNTTHTHNAPDTHTHVHTRAHTHIHTHIR